MYRERWQGERRDTGLPRQKAPPVEVEESAEAATACVTVLDKEGDEREVCGDVSFDSRDDGMV